jgi:hypothetical protein
MTHLSKFRLWLHEVWLQNCDEHRDFGELPYTKEKYFQMYKYWLKREFKHQRSIAHEHNKHSH